MHPLLRRSRLLSALVAALSSGAGGGAQSQPSAAPRMPALVERYCAKCHTGPDAEEGLEIAALFAAATSTPTSQPASAATSQPGSQPGPQPGPTASERIATVLQRIRSRTMPPQDGDQPSEAERSALAAAVAGLQPVVPGARIATLRRLSRHEYECTVRDLLGIAWSARDTLPEDPRAYGFDNIGDVLSVTPLLFEKYLDAAQAIAKAVLAKPAPRELLFNADQPLSATLPRFLERAFRRPAEPEEVRERLALHASLVASGGDPELAHAALLRSILASPAFLFRAELGDPTAPARLSAHELAVRLSYLLRSTLPDERLMALARSGALLEPEVLVAEAKRLVEGDGGRALADGFAAQWLRFRDVLTAAADSRAYPQIWNGRLRPSLYEEAARCFAELVRGDASILELIDSDHTFLDQTLSKHYGIGEVRGDAFVRVQLPDRRRGGVLGMGAVLMVTSYPLRTSPVLRGLYVLDHLLDAATPPPPANAGTLPADHDRPGEPTLRERLERHRKDRACASCHAQIDPLGFALENFDVLGVWRKELRGQPIDAHAMLPDGTELDGPIALKDALLARKGDFVRAMTRKLLVYAIGRPMVPDDEPDIEHIVAAVVAGEYRFSALLAAVVTSPLFTLRDPSGVR